MPRTHGGRLEDTNLKLMFNSIGFNNVVEVDEMESVCFADTTITGIPFTGQHGDLNIQAKSCHMVRSGN